jgi:hypothetical protein
VLLLSLRKKARAGEAEGAHDRVRAPAETTLIF